MIDLIKILKTILTPNTTGGILIRIPVYTDKNNSPFKR